MIGSCLHVSATGSRVASRISYAKKGCIVEWSDFIRRCGYLGARIDGGGRLVQIEITSNEQCPFYSIYPDR